MTPDDDALTTAVLARVEELAVENLHLRTEVEELRRREAHRLHSEACKATKIKRTLFNCSACRRWFTERKFRMQGGQNGYGAPSQPLTGVCIPCEQKKPTPTCVRESSV